MAEKGFAVLTAAVDGTAKVHTVAARIPDVAGLTRSGIFDKLRKDMADQNGVSADDLIPVFFTAEPDQIA